MLSKGDGVLSIHLCIQLDSVVLHPGQIGKSLIQDDGGIAYFVGSHDGRVLRANVLELTDKTENHQSNTR